MYRLEALATPYPESLTLRVGFRRVTGYRSKEPYTVAPRIISMSLMHSVE